MKKFILAITAFSLVAGFSCSKFDDSTINGRLDDLEDRVGGLESEIEAINQKLEGFNNTLRGFTDVLNGGIITNVERNATNDGWVFTVQNVADLSTKTYEVKDGDKGETGNDGNTPVLTTAYDEASGRYYWLIDGKEPNPRAWATGEKGDTGNTGATGGNGPQGEAGVTPQLAIAAASAADASKPDFSAADDEDLYWWVSYDYPGTGDKSRYTWEKLYTANTTAVKLDLSVEYTDGELVFYNAGQEIGRAEVQLGTNPLSLTFQLNGDEFDAYGTVRFSKGSDNTLTVNVEGASENAVVKASLQNENGTFGIEVDDMDINIVANVTGATNKLLVDVLDGANCYHSWVNLATNIPLVSIYLPQVDAYDYIPVAFGTGYEMMNNVPVKPEIIVEIDAPAVEDITFGVQWTEANIANAKLNSNTVTIKKGETSTTVDFEISSRVGLENDTYGCFVLSVESGEAMIPEDTEAWLCIANNFKKKVTLSEQNVIYPFDGKFESGTSLANLFDGDTATFMATPWNTAAQYEGHTEIAEFGLYVDVILPIPVSYAEFAYVGRNGNGWPKRLELGYSTDSGKTFTHYKSVSQAELPNAAAGARNEGVGGYGSATQFDALRFGVRESSMDMEITYPITDASKQYMALAELEVYYMY